MANSTSSTNQIEIQLKADDQASGPLSEFNAKLKDSADNIFSLNNIAQGAALGGLALVAGAMVGAGKAAFDLSTEFEGVGKRAKTQLGLSADEAVRFEGVMDNIYAANYGESFTDIGDALVTVEQNLKRIGGPESDEALQQITQRAFEIRDAFGVDVTESMGAVTTLMDQFGLTSEQAFGFITKGFQEGLNSSGDFIDTIGEYSNQFSQGGASATDFFNILQNGMQGGVLGTDKAADAFKEFGIRILDNSDTTRGALDAIGIDYEELRRGFADGSITTVEAMRTVIEKIREIEDPIERNVIGVALFGTQWEDLGETAVLALGDIKTSMGDVEKATADLGAQYETSLSGWELMTREWNLLLKDVGDASLPGIAWTIENVLRPAMANWKSDIGDIRTDLDRLWGWYQDFARRMGEYDWSFGSTQPNRAIVNPANIPGKPSLTPLTPSLQTPTSGSGAAIFTKPTSGLEAPTGWVGAWNPRMTANVTVNVVGADASNGARTGAQAGVNAALQQRGIR